MGGCSKPSTGRFDALARDTHMCDLDIPMMMFDDAGDVPIEPSKKERSGVPVLVSVPAPVLVPEYSNFEPEYPQEWMKIAMDKVTKKNLKAHGQPARHTAREATALRSVTREPQVTSLQSVPGNAGAGSSQLPVETGTPLNSEEKKQGRKELIEEFLTSSGPKLMIPIPKDQNLRSPQRPGKPGQSTS